MGNWYNFSLIIYIISIVWLCKYSIVKKEVKGVIKRLMLPRQQRVQSGTEGKPGVAVHAFDPRTQEQEAGGSLWARGQPGLIFWSDFIIPLEKRHSLKHMSRPWNFTFNILGYGWSYITETEESKATESRVSVSQNRGQPYASHLPRELNNNPEQVWILLKNTAFSKSFLPTPNILTTVLFWTDLYINVMK